MGAVSTEIASRAMRRTTGLLQVKAQVNGCAVNECSGTAVKMMCEL
jgi:hypothetical protein